MGRAFSVFARVSAGAVAYTSLFAALAIVNLEASAHAAPPRVVYGLVVSPSARPDTTPPAEAAAPAPSAALPVRGLEVEHEPARPVHEDGGAPDAAAPTARSRPAKSRRARAQEPERTAQLGAFDQEAARAALVSSMESLPVCRRGEVNGPGAAEVVFSPEGDVAHVALARPYAGTATGGCVSRRFTRARVPAFDGEPRVMRVRFRL